MRLKIATPQAPKETTASGRKAVAATNVPEGTQDGTWGGEPGQPWRRV